MASLDKLLRKPVCVYTFRFPETSGSGSAMRVYSNVRAYLDLGFNVIIYWFKRCQAPPFDEAKFDLQVKVEEVQFRSKKATLIERIAYRIGYPVTIGMNLVFEGRSSVQETVRRVEKRFPGAIHHFEYITTASAILGLPPIKSVWSCHDLSSKRTPLLWGMRQEIGVIQDARRNQHRLRTLTWAEEAIAEQAALVLAIAEHERQQLQSRTNKSNIELLPMSWPEEFPAVRQREWMANGKLRLLHLGVIDNLIGYNSLKFLLQDVLPVLPESVLSRIELIIAGETRGTEYSRLIFGLAASYPQVQFVGYVEDVKDLYKLVDLQVVGGHKATGVRTRILESFVLGVPVLSTITAARGILGLRSQDNIFLGESASDFADILSNILDRPDCLKDVSDQARKVYDGYYSRPVAANALKRLLEHHL